MYICTYENYALKININLLGTKIRIINCHRNTGKVEYLPLEVTQTKPA